MSQLLAGLLCTAAIAAAGSSAAAVQLKTPEQQLYQALIQKLNSAEVAAGESTSLTNDIQNCR